MKKWFAIDPEAMPFVEEIRTFAKRYFGVIVGLNLFLRVFRMFGKWDIPEGWPISEGRFKLPNLEGLVFVVLAGLLVYIFARRRDAILASFGKVLVFCLGFLILSNGFHGVQDGYVHPVLTPSSEGSPQEYFQDIDKVTTIPDFIRHYTTLQPDLLVHARTHPPGPVLLMRVAADLLHRPEAISIVLGCLSLLVMGLCFRQALRQSGTKAPDASFLTLLFLCCTQVQVYTIFTVDAVIAAFACALLAGITMSNRALSVLLSGLAFFCLLFLSFGSVYFALPMLYWLWRKDRLWDGLAICALGGLGLFALKVSLGYSWLESFRIASRIENPNGFELFHDPITYIATRFEDSFEPVLFIGPLLFMLVRRVAMRQREAADRSLEGEFMVVAIGTLLAIFLTGAYHTGETARACLFLVPFVFMGIGPELLAKAAKPVDRDTILRWVIGYTFVHQMLMFYFW